GLAHLHSLKLVHGDLKAVWAIQINVLVTRSGRAVLADFGLASVADSKVLLSTCSGKRGGTMRWYAPELFDGGRISFASDVYAFSCICYEIFTGDLPFCDLNNDGAVMFQVMQGQRPTRSLSIPDNVWDLMEECWKADPEARPSAKQIVSRLRDPPICAIPTDAASDWDPCYTSKFRSSLEEHTLFLSTGTCCRFALFLSRVNGRMVDFSFSGSIHTAQIEGSNRILPSPLSVVSFFTTQIQI
ncbi:kinase-like domain-containing protein, partial [Mycena capillaripes]